MAAFAAMLVQKGYYVPAPADAITYKTLMSQLDAIAKGVDATLKLPAFCNYMPSKGTVGIFPAVPLYV